MSDMNLDRIFTVAVVMLGFAVFCIFTTWSMDFQRRCESTCAPAQALTPVINFDESCLCDEGQGKWRRVDVFPTTGHN